MLKEKHLLVRVAQCDLIASSSPCPRRKVGALIIDPQTNVIISEGYNGTPRGSSYALCGGDTCERTTREIPSGTQNDVGCHHAEMNAILNATRTGNSTLGKWLVVNCDPCLMCAKAIHHAGISVVYAPCDENSSRKDGHEYLLRNKVHVYPTSLFQKG